MNATVEWPLRESTVRARNNVFATDNIGEPHNALGDKLGMLDHVGGVRDHAGNEHLPCPELGVLPHLPLVLVAQRIGRYAKLVGRENVIAGTDCGFAQAPFTTRVHPTIIWAKLEALAEGARLASKELWGK